MTLSTAALRATTALWLTTACPALAQTVAAADPQVPTAVQDDAGGIADILVTARRREESLQSAPVTVTLFRARSCRAGASTT